MADPHDILRYHVSGAIERGEGEAITEITANLLTFDEALNLQYGDILLDPRNKRWKVSGIVKTWKRSPERIRVPLKHGLYTYDALTEADFGPEGKCLLRRET